MTEFDFGFESRTVPYDLARVVLVFVAEEPVAAFGVAGGPHGIGDASRYAEFYVMEGDFSPFEVGVCAYLLDPKEGEGAFADQVIADGKIPVIVTSSPCIIGKNERVMFPSSSPEISVPKDVPVHLSVMFDALSRSGLSPEGRLPWYDYIDGIGEVVAQREVRSIELLVEPDLPPSSPIALLGAQVLVQIVAQLFLRGKQSRRDKR